jgi:hypothetical protein
MDYIAEANRFMYDDGYLVEAETPESVQKKIHDLHAKIEDEESKMIDAGKRKDWDVHKTWSRAWRNSLEELKKLQNKHIKVRASQSKKNGTHSDDGDIEDFKSWRSGFSNYKPAKKDWHAVKDDIMKKHGVDISKGHEYYHIPEIRKDIDKHKLG